MTIRRVAAAFAVLASLVLLPMGHAGAHSELQSSQPSAGESVGGHVHWIYLDFRGGIADPKVTVLDPDGEELSGQVKQPDDFSILYELNDHLTTEGQHIVRFETTSYDGAVEQSALAFTYDPTAPEFELEIPERPGTEGDDSVDWILIAGIALIVLGLGLLVVHRFRRAGDDRAAADGSDSDDPAASDTEDETTSEETDAEH